MIYKSIYSSPLGYLEICSDGGEAITRIYLSSTPSSEFTENELTKTAALQLSEYFEGKRENFDFPIEPDGTAFEKEVFRACTAIPYAESLSFKELAAKIGDEKAARKVGLAVDKNPILIAIPTHRVKGKTNFLAGFSTETAVKEALLGMEKNRKK